MGSTSAISFFSNPKILLRSNQHSQRVQLKVLRGACLGYSGHGAVLNANFLLRRKCLRFRAFEVKAAASSGGSRRSSTGRRVYRQSQSESSLSLAPVKQFASSVLPAGLLLVVTFVLWKLVDKLLVPKPQRSSTVENKTPVEGAKWSFAVGTNLLSGIGAKVERESKQKLNEFAKELRSFRSVDMSGRNFGDEGLFFLAESLGYNQTLEEVSFASNGITATGLKAFDGILQSNFMLKTLDLSGNPIGDEGVKCLCDTLVNNTGIQQLRLNSTDLGDEGAKAIAEMLKQNSSLLGLELNNNSIDYSGFTSLAGALLENKILQRLYLVNNYGGALGANALAKGLEGNKSLRSLIPLLGMEQSFRIHHTGLKFHDEIKIYLRSYRFF